jgi:hypothetical protein
LTDLNDLHVDVVQPPASYEEVSLMNATPAVLDRHHLCPFHAVNAIAPALAQVDWRPAIRHWPRTPTASVTHVALATAIARLLRRLRHR